MIPEIIADVIFITIWKKAVKRDIGEMCNMSGVLLLSNWKVVFVNKPEEAYDINCSQFSMYYHKLAHNTCNFSTKINFLFSKQISSDKTGHILGQHRKWHWGMSANIHKGIRIISAYILIYEKCRPTLCPTSSRFYCR